MGESGEQSCGGIPCLESKQENENLRVEGMTKSFSSGTELKRRTKTRRDVPNDLFLRGGGRKNTDKRRLKKLRNIQ